MSASGGLTVLVSLMGSSILSEVDNTSISGRGSQTRQRCPLSWLPVSRLLPPRSGLERSDFVLWHKAFVLQANREQLRWTAHSDLNRLPTAGRLWCAYVPPYVSVDCYRPVAAAGRRAGRARS